jgi:tetratricopeptide (TPR) repeat protein
MRLWASIALAVFAVLPMQAQRHKLEINAETPEGQLLQQIGTEADQQKKVALMEDFATKFPNHPGLAWVYGQLQPIYSKSNQFDKVFPITEKLLAFDPADAEMAHGALKAAEAKKDGELIVKWSGLTLEAAKKGEAIPKPQDEDEVEAWKHKVDFSKQVQKYAEYSLYAAALQEQDPKKKLLLIDTLSQRHPQSEYLPTLSEQSFLAYRQLGNNEKAIEIAEKSIAANTASEDMLLVATEQAFQKKEYDQVLNYSAKCVEIMKTKPAPQGVSPEDWERKKTAITGVALWMAGMSHAAKGNLTQTDAVLREALPLLAGNDLLLSHATFQLGLANHKMGEKGDAGRIQAAYNYFRQCSGIKGPNAGAAAKNVKVLAAQYRGLK